MKTLKPQFEALYEGIWPQKIVQKNFDQKDMIDHYNEHFETQLPIKFEPKQITESKVMTPENPYIYSL